MRNWASEIRIGIIAGVSAGAMMLLAPKVMTHLPSPDMSAGVHASWTPPLADPIQAANAALARGDSAFIAVTVNDTMEFPGLTAATGTRSANESVRWYSQTSTGLRAEQWEEFVPRVVPYAAAYNAVVHVARASARSRS